MLLSFLKQSFIRRCCLLEERYISISYLSMLYTVMLYAKFSDYYDNFELFLMTGTVR